MISIDVSCYAGHRGEETPRRIAIGGRQSDVVTVNDRWLAPDHRYFKILGDDGGVYIIRHDPLLGRWHLASYKASVDVDRFDMAGVGVPLPSKIC